MRAWARPQVMTGKRLQLVNLISAGMPAGVTLHLRPAGAVAVYRALGVSTTTRGQRHA